MGHYNHVGNLHHNFNFQKDSERFPTRASSFKSGLGYLESLNNLDFGNWPHASTQPYFSGTKNVPTSSCTRRVKSYKRGIYGAWTEQLIIISKARAYTDFHSYFYSIMGNIFFGFCWRSLAPPICIPQAHGSCSFSLRVFPPRFINPWNQR